MSTVYTPMKGTLPWKVIEFLTTNPDETLTVDDISVKFGVPVRGLPVQLTPAVDSGALVRAEHEDEDEMVYRLGAGHPKIKARPSVHPALGPVGAALTGGAATRRPRTYIDASAIQIDCDVPIPAHAGNGRTKWAALLDRMDRQDSAELPYSVRASLQKCVSKYAKSTQKKFTIRRIDGNTLRIWRTE